MNNKCSHFTGVHNITCNAGVAYADVAESVPDLNVVRPGVPGRVKSLPCIKERQGDCKCPAQSFPSAALLEAMQKQWIEDGRKRRAAIKAVLDETGGDNCRSGVLWCPVCDRGEMRWRVDGFGNIYAKCAQPKCVLIVE